MKKIILISCFSLLMLGGCARNNTLGGAVIGTGVGAAVSGGNPAAMLAGGVVGLTTGALIDSSQSSNSQMNVGVAYENGYQYNQIYYPAQYPPPFYPGFTFDSYYYAPAGSNVNVVFIAGGRRYPHYWRQSNGQRVSYDNNQSFRQRNQSHINQSRAMHGNNSQSARGRESIRQERPRQQQFQQRRQIQQNNNFGNTIYRQNQGQFNSNHDRLRHNDRVRAKQHKEKQQRRDR